MTALISAVLSDTVPDDASEDGVLEADDASTGAVLDEEGLDDFGAELSEEPSSELDDESMPEEDGAEDEQLGAGQLEEHFEDGQLAGEEQLEDDEQLLDEQLDDELLEDGQLDEEQPDEELLEEEQLEDEELEGGQDAKTVPPMSNNVVRVTVIESPTFEICPIGVFIMFSPFSFCQITKQKNGNENLDHDLKFGSSSFISYGSLAIIALALDPRLCVTAFRRFCLFHILLH